jgi:hypothetical protein
MSSSPWRVYFTIADIGGFDALEVEQRLARIIPNAAGRQALWLPVHPQDAVVEALPLLDPIYAHYVAQWRKIVPDSPETEFGRGFFLEGSVLPQEIADPSNVAELAAIAWRNIPADIRRRWEEEGVERRQALSIDPRMIEWDIYMARCVPAADLGVDPFPE